MTWFVVKTTFVSQQIKSNIGGNKILRRYLCKSKRFFCSNTKNKRYSSDKNEHNIYQKIACKYFDFCCCCFFCYALNQTHRKIKGKNV